MSSYVIEKSEYIKAAGLVAGIAEARNKWSSEGIWIYDYTENRNATAEDYYRQFSEIYRMNAESVRIQYNDPTAEQDDEPYSDVFAAARRRGEKAAFQPAELRRILFKLRGFFRHSEYQIEYEPYYWQAVTLFNRIIEALLGLLMTGADAEDALDLD